MQISTRGIVNLCLPCVVSRKYNQYLICMYLICIYVIGNEKKQILELFNMKLSKSIDQSRICKNSYDDPLGYFCMFFFFTCPSGQVTNKFHLSNGRFHLSRTIGQTLLSRPECLKMVLTPEIVI